MTDMQDNGEDNKVTAFFQGPVGKTYSFQMMAKQDTYNVSQTLGVGMDQS